METAEKIQEYADNYSDIWSERLPAEESLNFSIEKPLAVSVTSPAIEESIEAIETRHEYFVKKFNSMDQITNDVIGDISDASSDSFVQGCASGSNLTLLQTALSSLSLTDKCALSMSLSNIHQSSNSVCRSPPMSPRDHLKQSYDEFEVQSVWSESDKESLDVAMSLMGPHDLEKVEEEVKLIQNNVRAWLLRKNYTNLREAALVLQSAWRERKHHENKQKDIISGRAVSPQISRTKKRKTLNGSAMVDNYDEIVSGLKPQVDSCFIKKPGVDDAAKYSSAASTLQAVTRGMLARKFFGTAKKQAMASLVIQKSLLSWWVQNKHINDLSPKMQSSHS